MKFEVDLTHYRYVEGKKCLSKVRTIWVDVEEVQEMLQEQYKDYFGLDEICEVSVR